MSNLGPKMSYLGYFGAGIRNQNRRVFIKVKLCAKMKILKYMTKNALFWCFGK